MTYKESLHRIWLIAKREVHRLVAQPIYFFCMLIAPAICVIFFVSLMHEGLPTDLPIAVVDMDNSATSRNLIRQLDGFNCCLILNRMRKDGAFSLNKGKT